MRASLGLFLLLAGPAFGQDAAAGRTLARTWCAGCHLVEAQPASRDTVPSFAAIAARPDTSAESVRSFLRNPHAPMPDLRLTEAQIADLAAYIMSLRPAR